MRIILHNDLEQPDTGTFNLSISDLMAGLLAIFILLLCVVIKNYDTTVQQASINYESRWELLEEIKTTMESKGFKVEIDDKHEVVSFPDSDIKIFESGSAELNKEAKPLFDKFSETLLVLLTTPKYKGAIETIFIEGHTDEVSIGNFLKYEDNWELSTARAVHTWHYMNGTVPNEDNVGKLGGLKNIKGEFLFSCSGYAATRPPKDLQGEKSKEKLTEKDRSRMRRIDFRFAVVGLSEEETKEMVGKFNEFNSGDGR